MDHFDNGNLTLAKGLTTGYLPKMDSPSPAAPCVTDQFVCPFRRRNRS